jgi:hypothetical protein
LVRLSVSEAPTSAKEPVRPTPYYEKPYYDYGKGKGKDAAYAWSPKKGDKGKKDKGKGKKGKYEKGHGKGKDE